MEITIIVIVSFVVALLLVVTIVKICMRFNVCQCCDKDADSLAESLDNDDDDNLGDDLDDDCCDRNSEEDNDIGSLHMEDQDTITHVSDQTRLCDDSLHGGEEINTVDTQRLPGNTHHTNTCTHNTMYTSPNGHLHEPTKVQCKEVLFQQPQTHRVVDSCTVKPYPGHPYPTVDSTRYPGSDHGSQSVQYPPHNLDHYSLLTSSSSCRHEQSEVSYDNNTNERRLLVEDYNDHHKGISTQLTSSSEDHRRVINRDKSSDTGSQMKMSSLVMENPVFSASVGCESGT